VCCKYEASKEIEKYINQIDEMFCLTQVTQQNKTKLCLIHITDWRNKKNGSKISKGVMKLQINLIFKT
jgi:hypothetical protein